jgi:FkbM family methyltransferase
LAGLIGRLQSGLQYWVRQYRKNPYVAKKKILAAAEPGVIFDIGANRGDTTAAYAKYFPESMIYSFEPFPESCDKLKARFKDNPKIRIIEMAISNRQGMLDFYSNADSATNSLLPVGGEAERWSDMPDAVVLKDVVKVPATTIDDFCAKEGIDRIMIMKMDMQGGELQALEGAKKMLTGKGISLIFSELLFVPLYVGQAEYHQVCGLLAKFGYRLFDMYSCAYDRSGKVKWCDGLFVGPGV